ncbi:MAG TPA: aldehyde dehydrogenase family protein, partial [Burkholderiales bacterium]|nr:aldehyde dehydrogenase family protein [Burkholderiales bacterium]
MNKPAEAGSMASVDLWIGGKRQRASATRHGNVTDPATGAVTRRVPFCNAADVDAAVQAAAAALPGWRDTPALRRARVMQKFLQLVQAHQRDLARLVTEEHGKTLPDAMGSVQR